LIKISVTVKEPGISGPFRVRDVWRQMDPGEYSDHFEAEIPFHGVSIIRISK
jgi:alpha-galactosidase